MKKFIADHIVSWILEVIMVSVIGFFSIQEIRKTGEETREIIHKYDKAISSTAVDAKKEITNRIKIRLDGIKKK